MYGSLCTPSFYVTWCHFRSIRVSVLFECLCRLVSRPFCTGLYIRVSISLGHTSILYRSLCYPRFYVTLSHFVLYVSLCCPRFYVTLFCMCLYVVRVSMSLRLTPVTYCSLCCLTLLRFVVDITVSGKSPPHRNQRRQFAKLLLQNK